MTVQDVIFSVFSKQKTDLTWVHRHSTFLFDIMLLDLRDPILHSNLLSACSINFLLSAVISSLDGLLLAAAALQGDILDAAAVLIGSSIDQIIMRDISQA